MGFQARDPRDLVHFTSRIPRHHREMLREQARQLEITETELHRRLLDRGFEALKREMVT
jgi:hypothetical protein